MFCSLFQVKILSTIEAIGLCLKLNSWYSHMLLTKMLNLFYILLQFMNLHATLTFIN
jgi:hypothetical protein